jgi:hypothetical protein
MQPKPAPPTLSPETAARLAEFARTCKAAARAVSLYPAAHPAIATSLDRLVRITATLTEQGPFRCQVLADSLLVDGMAPPKPDLAISELAELLHRHLIGQLTLNAGIDTGSWRTLLLLLARSPEDVRADGGIAHLWTTAGGPSIEIQEIDYGEVLREKLGGSAAIQEIIAAALAGPQLQLDDSGMRLLLEIVGDPARLDELLDQLEMSTAQHGPDARTAAFLSLLRGLTDWVARNEPGKLEGVLKEMGRAAGRLTADGMLTLLAERNRPEAKVGSINVAGAVVDRMSDSSVVQFVAGSVIAEHGASERLAHAFQALVPDVDRQRQLLALAEDEVTASPLGQEETFSELWSRVEGMLTSYSDESYVSDEYGRELSSARAQAVDVERTSDDPPERIAAWLSTVSDAALRGLDHQLLLDLLEIEPDALRWRDIADTVATHADDLVRVGYFDQAWHLAEVLAREGVKSPERQPHAAAALERFGRGAMMKHVAPHLRVADDDSYERFKRLCHAIGPAVIAPLAEALSTEQDARSRRRLRDILIGFGAKGRESVQPLMNAPNWEVRRTAAYLLREFGGSEGLKELVPLLADSEPLVQREAVQGLIMNGTEEAAEMLLRAITSASGRSRDVLINELSATRDPRAAPMLCYFVRHLDRRAQPALYVSAVDALGSFGGPEAVDALKFALHQGDWWAPMKSRQVRAAAAKALRRIGTTDALETLRDAAARGRWGVKAAARAELARLA